MDGNVRPHGRARRAGGECIHENAGHKPGAASDFRSRARTVAREVTRSAPWEPRPRRLPRRQLRPPYSRTDDRRLWADSHRQATAGRPRVMVGVLALTFGAGLRPTELPRAHTSWVVRSGGVTFVEVPGKHVRRIPVAEPYAPVLWQLKADHPGELLLGERNNRNALNDPLSALEYGPATPSWIPAGPAAHGSCGGWLPAHPCRWWPKRPG